MTRLTVLVLSALIAAAPLSAATAQDRGGRGDRSPPQQNQCPAPSMGDSQAQSIARSQVPREAEFKSSRQSCGVYIVTFEHNGRIINIQVDARR